MNTPHSNYPYTRRSTKRLIRWLRNSYLVREMVYDSFKRQAPSTRLRHLYWLDYQNLQLDCVSIKRVLENRSVNTQQIYTDTVGKVEK